MRRINIDRNGQRDVATNQDLADMFNAMCWSINQKAPGLLVLSERINFEELAAFVSSAGSLIVGISSNRIYHFRITAFQSDEAADRNRVNNAERALHALKNAFQFATTITIHNQSVYQYFPYVDNKEGRGIDSSRFALNFSDRIVQEIRCAFMNGDLHCSAFDNNNHEVEGVINLIRGSLVSGIIDYFDGTNVMERLAQYNGCPGCSYLFSF